MANCLLDGVSLADVMENVHNNRDHLCYQISAAFKAMVCISPLCIMNVCRGMIITRMEGQDPILVDNLQGELK